MTPIDRQVRRLGLVMVVLFGALFVQLNVVQLVQADERRDHELNTREIERAFSAARGPIVTSDGVVMAHTIDVQTDLERLRVYPEGELYAHITGYLSLNHGATGLERELNSELAGRTTRQQLDGLDSLFDDEPNVATVVTTIDSRVQSAARDALGGRRGSVVALDPTSGDVLAMYSNPSYDPNLLASHDLAAVRFARAVLLGDPADPLLAKTYREVYEPGSTFKVVTASAALSTGLMTPDEPEFPESTEYLPPLTDNPIENFGGASCGGNLREALRVSCNTVFAEIGVLLGAEDLAAEAEAYGFNSVPPFTLGDGAASRFPEPERFDQATPLLAQSAIGQFDVRATPLEMALIAAGIANRGQMMAPNLIEEVHDRDGSVLEDPEPDQWRRATSAAIAEELRLLLGDVATDGTARRMVPAGSTAGGKTGTAQIGRSDLNHAWLIGFAPLESPSVAVAALIESTGSTGGTEAAPVARTVLEAALAAGH